MSVEKSISTGNGIEPRVLVVSNMYPSNENPGYGVFVRNFVESLRAQRVHIDCTVIQGRGKHKLYKILKYLNFGWEVLRAGLFGRYDCVYVHYLAHSMLPVVLLFKARRLPLVCNAHGEDLLPSSTLERLVFRMVKGTLEKAKLIVVPSDYFASVARKLFPHNEVFVSPSAGVDLDVFHPLALATHREPHTPLRIGFVSRIDAGKGWDVLLIAIRRLREHVPAMPLSVALVGEGAEVLELTRRIGELDLKGVVSHLGAMPQRELPKFYSSLDVFAFPTTLPESLGLVGLEALACGVPAICSDIGGIRSYMRDEINGYLFPPGDSDALAQRILSFSRLSSEKITEMRTAAIATAQHYGRTKVSADLYAKLAEVIGI